MLRDNAVILNGLLALHHLSPSVTVEQLDTESPAQSSSGQTLSGKTADIILHAINRLQLVIFYFYIFLFCNLCLFT